MKADALINEIKSGAYDSLLVDIYVDDVVIPYQKGRYVTSIEKFISIYGNDDVEIYSAPGRTEVCGNHTDHQHGEVLAGAINKDAIAVVKKCNNQVVKIVSEGYDMITVNLDELEYKDSEKESTLSLIKGVLYKAKELGYKIGGFQAYITSDVLIGAGLSSSAAFETVIGTILSGLYNQMTIDPIVIAQIGQFAENDYFGKPCGLMDQMACSVGSLVHINFANPDKPVVEKVVLDLNKHGYSLCITDTKGSHADLTADYAAVPEEMKKVANFFGKETLLGITLGDIVSQLEQIRSLVGDRAVLRSIHFVFENNRVQNAVKALKDEKVDRFLEEIKTSGNSSYKFLQNVYSSSDVTHQNVSLALALSEIFLDGHGVCRVHGGGFAGTIQAFVENEFVEEYQRKMNEAFGANSCNILQIRKYGGMKVI